MEKTAGILTTIKNGFKKLTKREQVMIYGLVIIVVLAVSIFLIILPAMNHLTTLSDDVSKYQSEEMDMRLTISQADTYDEQYKIANKSFLALKKQFYMPMDPESLDETITALIMQSGLTPKNLNMTTLQETQIPPYSTPALASAGVVQTTSDGAVADSTGSAADTNNNEAAAAGSGAQAYIYTVSATAEGDKSKVAKLIDIVNDTSGIELSSYSFSLTGGNSETDSVVMGGTVTMQFYVYVYVDNTSSND